MDGVKGQMMKLHIKWPLSIAKSEKRERKLIVRIYCTTCDHTNRFKNFRLEAVKNNETEGELIFKSLLYVLQLLPFIRDRLQLNVLEFIVTFTGSRIPDRK